MSTISTHHLDHLAQQLRGELHHGSLMRTLYATDASVYRELPLAVAIPQDEADLKTLIRFANEHGTSLIPRAAGTSLAGQCVGAGIVVDTSVHFNRILELNVEERWVRLQPGVVRDHLNDYLAPHGLFFSPITSTANRAMIGGMVGNNASGFTSIRYGTTRERTKAVRALLSDGSEATFQALTTEEFWTKTKLDSLEGRIYAHLAKTLQSSNFRTLIKEEFPRPDIHRRNTGYAIDFLAQSDPFEQNGVPFDLVKLLCGSEGTLAFTTEVTLHLDPLPAPETVLVVPHFTSINDCMRATQIAMRHAPYACEMMDRVILDCTKNNLEQRKNRDFVEGDPASLLMIEFRADTRAELDEAAAALVADLQAEELGYAFPRIHGADTKRAWDLRKAGLGLLANIPGDRKAVACIEDTAVALEDLPAYIREFTALMEEFGQQSVYYAHAGAGELHLRPILNLKDPRDVDDFYAITERVAALVKKYRGSLSGEHGDGRVRAGFLKKMVGEEIYEALRRLKQVWDPNGIFNPGKIVDAPPMTANLRPDPGAETPMYHTMYDYASAGGILRLAEKCNGSGDCRKTTGVMCPSYQVTRREQHTTRARANVLREVLSQPVEKGANPFARPEIAEAMDLCMSCKGCTAECPSNVDVSTLKSEWQYQKYQTEGVPLRVRAIANLGRLNALGSIAPGLTNFVLRNRFTAGAMKRTLGIAPQRSLPPLGKTTLRKWFQRNYDALPHPATERGSLYLFCDEFTNYNDVEVGIKTVQLLRKLGYAIRLIDHADSGRAPMSKGLLDDAQRCATTNVDAFRNIVHGDMPLVGIEPSALLSFRDEYPRLVAEEDRAAAWALAENCFLLGEFLLREVEAGRLSEADFSARPVHFLLHGHCHQKALSEVGRLAQVLSLPKNATVEVIPSGCCGMAGMFMSSNKSGGPGS